jgi:phosphate uptake regulator
MIRKIIKQGHNTLTMTLPAEWVKRFNLKAGSEIDLIERDNGLFISTQRNNDKKKTEFDISNMDIPTAWKYFMATYREGYDEVRVKFDPDMKFENPYKFFTKHRLDLRIKKEKEKKPIFGALQGFVNRFIGWEIVDHGNDYILIKEMGELTSREFDNSLRKIFFLIQGMAEETLESIEKDNTKALEHIHDVDVNLDKFHDFCIRILNKTGHKDPKKSELLFSTLFLLELVGDEFKNISVHLIQDFIGKKFSHLKDLASAVKKSFDSYQGLFYKFEPEKINEISKIDSETYFNVPQMYKKANEEEKEIFHHLRIIGRHINSLLELRIEMEF